MILTKFSIHRTLEGTEIEKGVSMADRQEVKILENVNFIILF